jgi:hypothetical protein
MWAGRRIPFACGLLPAAAPLLLCGCLGRNYVDPDYRYRDGHVAELREHLYSGAFGAASRHGEDAARPESTHHAAYHEAAPAPRRLTLTAAPEGERGGALRVVLELHDQAGRSVHVPASLHLAVLEPGPESQTTILGDWDLPGELLEHAWIASWSGGGYRLLLPWKTWPSAARVRVRARLTLADGTPCEAEQEVPLRAAATGTTAPPVPVAGPPPGGAGDTGVTQVRADVPRWEPPSLEGAVRIGRPVRLAADE